MNRPSERLPEDAEAGLPDDGLFTSRVGGDPPVAGASPGWVGTVASPGRGESDAPQKGQNRLAAGRLLRQDVHSRGMVVGSGPRSSCAGGPMSTAAAALLIFGLMCPNIHCVLAGCGHATYNFSEWKEVIRSCSASKRSN